MTANRIVIFDTTLRDGEQSPGASLNIGQKVEVARALARLKVDVIEAGFPISSPGDFEAVHTIASEIKGPVIAGLARSLDKDIECAAEAVAPAGDRARIHVFLATSEIHRKYKLLKAKDEIIRQAVAGVTCAKRFTQDVEFSPEDASRTEPDFLVEVVQAVIDAGATTVNIPDTVGYAVPERFGDLIAKLATDVKGMNRAVLSVHCHNDLGLAVSNSLAAVRAGAGQIECTINGLGERAGNASLEEVVMAIKTRRDFYDVSTRIDTTRIMATSRLVSKLTGMYVQRNKAIVGENAFAHEAGIHQDGVLKERTTYEIMHPEDIGLLKNTLVLGKHSGRHAFRQRIEELGHQLSDERIKALFERFKELADKKKDIYDEDLETLIEEDMYQFPEMFHLESLHISSGTDAIPTATVRISKKDQPPQQDAAVGDGPVDAVFKAIDRITGYPGKLLDYQIRAITSGKDAMGEVSLRLACENRQVHARARSTDIIEASAQAYLRAVNKAVLRKGKSLNPAEQPPPQP